MYRKIVAVWLSLLMMFGFIVIIVEIVPRVEAPTTHYVGGQNPGNYSKIQWAIDNASDGDTVFVYNGTYYENIIVNKTINLTGKDKETTIIDGGGNGNVTLITVDHVNMTGFTVKGSGGEYINGGIKLDNVRNCKIVNNTVSNNHIGIYLKSADNNLIHNNFAYFNDNIGISLENSNSNNLTENNASYNNDLSSLVRSGINLFRSSYNKIYKNYAFNNLYGIKLRFNVNNYISKNIVSNNTYGFHVDDALNNNITDNIAIKNNVGIFILNSDKNIVTQNNISSCDFWGIYLYSCSMNNITLNNITDGRGGVYLELSDSNLIEDNNLLSNSDFGISLDSSYTNNFISNNIFYSNHGIYLYNSQRNNISFNNVSMNINDGIRLDDSFRNNITGNIAINTSYGLILDSSGLNEIKENIFILNDNYGLSLSFSDYNLVYRNNISNNDHGIHLDSSNENKIIKNNLHINMREGIWLISSTKNNITYNNVSKNENYGLRLSSSSFTNITYNLIISNIDEGIYLSSSNNNSIYYNSIINNINQAFDDSSNDNQWDNGYPYGGNYWSDYSGVDFYKGPNQNIPDSDGIGDTPYTNIQGGTGAQDNYPLMQPYKPLENYTVLRQGWNLVSIPLIQEERNLTRVLGSIEGWYDAVQWYDPLDMDDHWKHKKIGKPYGNDLSELNETMGFWIHITQPGDTIFVYNGTEPSVNQQITLYPGWNQVGYPSKTVYNRTDGLNTVNFGTEVDIVQWYDAGTQTWHEMGPDDYFVHTRGYWIHAISECVWEVPL